VLMVADQFAQLFCAAGGVGVGAHAGVIIGQGP
jgi:hypothetical protein